MGESGDEPDDKSGATVADTPRTRAAASLGSLPPRFTVSRTLGEGGMGTVVEAYDRVLSRDVAIKVLARDHQHDPGVGARFLREARAAARLRHPGIVQVYDIDPDGGFIVMELVRGESLATKLRRERVLPAAEVRRIGRALLDALAIAHAAGIVHRDVKPANVLLGDDGGVKLADFGVAFFGDSDLTMPGTRIGTPAYMPPEQLRAKEVDARADVYAAGATLFEAATGKRLTDDETMTNPHAAVLEATGDRVLADAITRAVRERASERYSDGAAFATALDATEVPTTRTPTAPPSRRRVIAAAAVAVAMAAGGGAYVLTRPHGVVMAPISKHHVIACLPFTDKTGNPLLDFAAAGLPNLLGLELHGVPEVTVIGYYQLLGVAGSDASPDGWLAAAKQLGADVIVRGEITTANAGVHVSIIVETATGKRLDRLERDATVEGVPEVVRNTAPQLMAITLGRSVKTTPMSLSFDADRELQLGIADLEREHLPDAITHLRAAIHHAPDLALAHYYLATALSWNVPPTEPARAEIAKALASGGLDEAQRGFLRGMRHIVDQDFVGGTDELRPLAEKFPDDRDILYALFECMFHGGQPGEAMSVYHRIVKLAPKFRLALIHAFTFYVSHADDEGMSWALALGDPTGDSYSRLWESRILMARREYPAAIGFLSQRIEEAKDDASTGDLRSELATAYAVSDQLDLAAALIAKLGAPNQVSIAQVLVGISAARGDAAGFAKAQAMVLRASLLMPLGPGRTIALTVLAGAMLASASHDQLAAVSMAIDDSIVADYGRSLNLNVIQTLLAEALGDDTRLAALAKIPYPEVSELATAAIARARGDHATAATSTRRAIAASGDARFLIDEWWRLASDLRAEHDHAGVIAACDEVIRPRLFNWSWGATLDECLAWTADANEALGNRDAARGAWTRLVATRTAAAAGDPFVAAARAGLR